MDKGATVRVVPCPKDQAGLVFGWLGDRRRHPAVPRPDAVLIDPVLGASPAAIARLSAGSGIPAFSPAAWRLEALSRLVGPRAAGVETWVFWPEGLSVRAPAQALARAALGFLARLSYEIRLTHTPVRPTGPPGADSAAPPSRISPSGRFARDLDEVREVILETCGTPCHVVDRPDPGLWALTGGATHLDRSGALDHPAGSSPTGPLLAYPSDGGDPPLVVDLAGALETAGPARVAPERPAGAVLISVGAEVPAGVTFKPPLWPLALPLASGVSGKPGVPGPLPAPLAEALTLAGLGSVGLRAAQRVAKNPTSLKSLQETAALYGRAVGGPLPMYQHWAWRHLNFLTKGGNRA